MNLILIHGRDQQGKDPSKLKKEWIDTLKIGLAKNSLELPEDVNIVFPFYGDLLDSFSKDVTNPGSITGVIAKGSIAEKQLTFYFDILSEIALNAKIDDHKIKETSISIQEKGPLNWGWIQAILRALDAYSSFGDTSLEKFTYDVFVYLTIPEIRRQINEFILSSIKEGPTVIVGHSLGSVVGYNVLRELKGSDVKKYITIGSPLGLKSIKAQLDTPLRMPSSVTGGWYNAYDERDFVALNPLDKKNFNISPSIVNSNHVNNQTKNRHGIIGYLNDAAVAGEIHKYLTSSGE
ncbi:hypothetical protein [Flavobacterium sp. FlaQc-47]|uniref:hypothetical protein n=1 Tax=Flavobacterium sp. FlaQc-47 TaxID=3374180 RepID=UPI0037563529